MNNKGQIFSVDFIIAVSIGLVFLGLLITSSELRVYSLKENRVNDELINKTNTVLIALVNGEYSCKTDNNIFLPFSINSSEFYLLNKSQIKQYLLLDKNISLKIGDNLIVDDNMGVEEFVLKDIIALDFEVLVCNGLVSFADLNNCIIRDNCDLNKEIISLKVVK